MAYGDFKDLTTRTASDKYCVIKHLVLLKIDVDLLQWFTIFLIKKTSGSVKNENISNK